MKRNQREALFIAQGLVSADAILIASDVQFMAVLKSLNLADNRLCGVWYEGLQQKGTYDASGIKALASALAGSAVLTKLDVRRNYMDDDAKQTLRRATEGRENFVLEM